jgi:uncharacterized protein YbgA (DUF1722 family)
MVLKRTSVLELRAVDMRELAYHFEQILAEFDGDSKHIRAFVLVDGFFKDHVSNVERHWFSIGVDEDRR